MSATLSVFKLSVQSVHQLQQHKIEVSFEITQGCLIIELIRQPMWQIIPYRRKAVFNSAVLVGFGRPI